VGVPSWSNQALAKEAETPSKKIKNKSRRRQRAADSYKVRGQQQSSRQQRATAAANRHTAAAADSSSRQQQQQQQTAAGQTAVGQKELREGSRRAGPTGPSSRRRRENRRKNASCDAEGSERSPGGEREHLPETRSAARRVGSRIGERQWPEKANRRVEKWKDVGPSDVRGRIRGSVGIEENTIAEFDIVGSSGSETMPKEPPATRRVRQRSIVGMGAKEMTVVEPIRSVSRGSREGLR
jgi:hypothetical protein